MSSTTVPAATTNPVAIEASDTSKTQTPSIPLRLAGWLFDLLSRPQPISLQLRRRDRAIRHYQRQHRGRTRLHQTMMVIYSLVCIVCVALTWAFFCTDLIRPHCAPDTPFAGITVLAALAGGGLAFYAGYQIHGIDKEARNFGEFYLKCTNDDGTINIDAASDHDYGDRIIDGRVFVTMAEIYGWYCKKN